MIDDTDIQPAVLVTTWDGGIVTRELGPRRVLETIAAARKDAPVVESVRVVNATQRDIRELD